ncbi:MAG: hypothetical protein IJR81_02540, partial [Clostridia bacterium]|nr:hypothetical protein [Clostridia bacterium]
EGSIHAVQTPFAYLGYKKLNGMAKTPLKPMPDGDLFDVGHYIDHELVTNVEHDCQKRLERLNSGKPVRFLMTVGGAGAGGDLYLAMTRHLLPYIQAGQAELWINFGDHLTMWDVFQKEMPELKSIVRTYFDDWQGLRAWADTLDGDSPAGITAFCHKDIFEAVYSTNLLMRKCDVLVTKPSELAFYPVPKLMMRHIGGHEVYGAVHAQELGDSTFECETAPALSDMIDTLIQDPAILKHVCNRIVTLKNQGVYNGGYEVVKLAIHGR